MDKYIVFDRQLTKADLVVLQSLTEDLREHTRKEGGDGAAKANGKTLNASTPDVDAEASNDGTSPNQHANQLSYEEAVRHLQALNDPNDAHFEPTIMNNLDFDQIKLPPVLDKLLLRPYIRIARSLVRVETDVIMLTHLLLYVFTSIPSAVFLFYSFTWIHGVLHFLMQFSYMGTYTLMMHQHIHMRGILHKRLALFDHIFPYILDPLMGHTWNSYFYHHVKHHHIEGNGPNDLSSTIRYQRDSLLHFLHYTGRFFFFIWAELPYYFIRKGRTSLAFKAAFWELSTYTSLYTLYRINPRATVFVFLIPLFLLRLGLMAGNWGQHAFVDADEPDSDYRSSITLIDVASNRHCFNDGYHTSHHLNPMRHWREHPVSFLKTKHIYASQQALVFHDIDYLMVTVRLLMKDYKRLAECLVPIGSQMSLNMDERVKLLQRHTRRFSEDEIKHKFKTP
ncbi:hypothetical protein FSOLCH5_014220 [Fusarium solani]|uniref:uncharacterized protein n=1 Tax=Fusarium solani TaxID=169388 RepID=UPI00231BF77D|nr:hypothetical protein MRS44_015368 [Fusarium solani]KAJ4217933.1 hypothetical protein NW759_008526 [Fusarium solani]